MPNNNLTVETRPVDLDPLMRMEDLTPVPDVQIAERVDLTELQREKVIARDPLRDSFAREAVRPIDFDRYSAVLLSRIREEILAKWRASGGAASRLGLPLDPQARLVQGVDGPRIDFRGGTIKSGGAVEVTHTARVKLVGYSVEQRQEGADEIFGELAVSIPSIKGLQLTSIPLREGIEDRNRIQAFDTVLYVGAPAKITINITMVESDDTDDMNAIRAAFRQKAVEVLKDQYGDVDLNDATAGLVRERSAWDVAMDWSKTIIDKVLAAVFGMGDDPYRPGVLEISDADLMNPPPLQEYRFPGSNGVIAFTHKAIVTGRDDGGDDGRIALLFRVDPV